MRQLERASMHHLEFEMKGMNTTRLSGGLSQPTQEVTEIVWFPRKERIFYNQRNRIYFWLLANSDHIGFTIHLRDINGFEGVSVIELKAPKESKMMISYAVMRKYLDFLDSKSEREKSIQVSKNIGINSKHTSFLAIETRQDAVSNTPQLHKIPVHLMKKEEPAIAFAASANFTTRGLKMTLYHSP